MHIKTDIAVITIYLLVEGFILLRNKGGKPRYRGTFIGKLHIFLFGKEKDDESDEIKGLYTRFDYWLWFT